MGGAAVGGALARYLGSVNMFLFILNFSGAEGADLTIKEIDVKIKNERSVFRGLPL